MIFNVVLVGTGGQGVISASNILGWTALKMGYQVRSAETHGMAQRGGTVIVHLRFGQDLESPLVRTHSADVILSFELIEAIRYLDFLKPDGLLLVNNETIIPPVLFRGQHMVVNSERCIGCGNCRANCLVNIYYQNLDALIAINSPASQVLNGQCEILDGCTGCMLCTGICPNYALELKKELSYPPYSDIERAIHARSKNSYILSVSKVALELGDIRMVNTIMMGALLAFDKIPLKYEVLQEALRQILKPSIVDLNLKALEAGRQLIQQYRA
ncbi:MAG: 2-oxoacid:acceptor oxidoreductase family protein [Candidatus Helarchaeota archaeon]